MPGDCPLVDKLLVKSKSNGPWKYPTPTELEKMTKCRQITDEWLTSTTWFVYTFEKDSQELLQEIITTATYLYDQDECAWPGTVASLKVTSICVSTDISRSLLSADSRGAENSFALYDEEGEGSFSLPTKIIIAGSDWSVTFQLPIEVVDDTAPLP